MLTNDKQSSKELQYDGIIIDYDSNHFNINLTVYDLAVVTEQAVQEVFEDIEIGLLSASIKSERYYISHDEVVNYIFGVFGEDSDYYLDRLYIMDQMIISHFWKPNTPNYIKSEDITNCYNSKV